MDCTSKIKILNWNVRGLNGKDKRLAVRQSILLEKSDVVCLQETKLNVINNTLVSQICGGRFKEFVYLEADGTKGGILLAWNARKYKLLHSSKGVYTVTTKLEHNGVECQISAVYGPTSAQLRRNFFLEIQDSQPPDGIPWLLCGDFNVTLSSGDRTNLNNNNWRESIKFNELLLELDLIDLPLRGRNYTWSNTREHPTMARLDRFLISPRWSNSFPN